jgi:Tfp pilus assembly protein PilP
MRTPFFLTGAVAAFVLTTSPASAQTPAGAPAAVTPPAAAQGEAGTLPPVPVPPPDPNYTYQPDSRRDPFLNLLGTGAEPLVAGKRGEGASGLTIAEVSVSGVLESRGVLIAMIQGPDKKSYIVRAGDRFADGTIRSVTSQGLTIVQEVNDPLSLVKQREIHKLLRSLESAKE